MADVAEVAASKGGSYGAQFAARFLPIEQYQIKMKINGTPETILAKVYAFFASNGRVENETAAANSPFPMISGVIGSGLLRMNPAVIQAEIVAIKSGVCTLLITGAAKEGLIKQHNTPLERLFSGSLNG